MQHLIDPMDLSKKEIDDMLALAQDIMRNKEKYRDICKYKKLATLFYEPSTRTRLSFESAMLELGGSVLGFSEASSSSARKGESVEDTVRVVGCFADIIAMRHPNEGAPKLASMYSPVPIINAGDDRIREINVNSRDLSVDEAAQHADFVIAHLHDGVADFVTVGVTQESLFDVLGKLAVIYIVAYVDLAREHYGVDKVK